MSVRSSPVAAAAAAGAVDRTAPRNEVVLVGRVPAAPQERELPSGDRMVTWRMIVSREPVRRPPEGVRSTTVDTLDCVAWTAAARRAARALAADDVVEVRGALRRRFWERAPAPPAGARSRQPRCGASAAGPRDQRRSTLDLADGISGGTLASGRSSRLSCRPRPGGGG